MRAWPLVLTLFTSACVTAPIGRDAADPADSRALPAPAQSVVAAATDLPQVPLRGLDDKPLRLEEAAAGKPALVTFWATWCEACFAEFDALNRLDARLRQSGGVVIGVAVGEPREKAAAFAQQHGLRYLQLVDEKMGLADALGQKRLPATLVLDRRGKVVFVGGALDEKALGALRAAMGG